MPLRARVVHLAAAVGLAALLAGLVARGATDAWRVLAWLAIPEAALLVGLWARSGPRGREAWRAFDDVLHSRVVCAATFLLASAIQGHLVWPVLGWLVHVETEAAAGARLSRLVARASPP